MATMLTKSMTTAMLPVSDMDRAARFYGETLGLEEIHTMPDGGHVYATGQGALGLMAAEPGAQSAHTVLTFEVPDIRKEITELSGRGVTFADYDLPDLKTVDHVADLGGEKAAWFTDTEGNILCIHEPPA